MMDKTASGFDIAIVGFGPAGAVAAAQLGQAGLRVLVIDKAHEVYDKPRAVSMDHEIMRTLQGIGVAGQVAAHVEPFSPSEHYGADGQLIRRLDMVEPPYPMGWIPSMVFLQPAVEAVVRARVAALPEVEIRLGTELTGLAQDDTGATLALTTAGRGTSGHVEWVRARYVIGCDGASSAVRRLAGIALEDLGFDEPWLVVDLRVNPAGLAKLPKISAHYCEPARPTTFIIGTSNHRRWEIMLLPDEDPRAMEREAAVWPLLARWLTPDDARLWRSASYRFHALVATRWRERRVFIAGDAAHQQPPFLGQGMCQGLRDVTNLTWKLREVVRHQAPDCLLDSYTTERAGHVRQLTATIQQIGRSICERDTVTAQRRDAHLLREVGGIVKTVPRQDLIPGLHSGFFSSQPHAARGTLFPQPNVHSDSGIVRLDDVSGSGWRVVLNEAASAWQPVLPDTITLIRCTMLSIRPAQPTGAALSAHAIEWRETEGVVHAWFTRYACFAAIVRPDHYVYAVARCREELQCELTKLAQRHSVGKPIQIPR